MRFERTEVMQQNFGRRTFEVIREAEKFRCQENRMLLANEKKISPKNLKGFESSSANAPKRFKVRKARPASTFQHSSFFVPFSSVSIRFKSSKGNNTNDSSSNDINSSSNSTNGNNGSRCRAWSHRQISNCFDLPKSPSVVFVCLFEWRIKYFVKSINGYDESMRNLVELFQLLHIGWSIMLVIWLADQTPRTNHYLLLKQAEPQWLYTVHEVIQ